MCESIPAASIPRANPRAYPGHLKNIQMPGPAGKFCWQIPGPPFLQWWSNARTFSPSDPATCKIISCHILINITVSAQKNCIKQVTKWVTPTEKRQSKWFYCFYRSFMADKCSSPTPNDSVWLLDSERRWKWRPDVTRLRNKFVVVCKCPGGRDTINYKCPGPGLIVKQKPGICPGAMLAVGIDSHITLEASKKKCYTNTWGRGRGVNRIPLLLSTQFIQLPCIWYM